MQYMYDPNYDDGIHTPNQLTLSQGLNHGPGSMMNMSKDYFTLSDGTVLNIKSGKVVREGSLRSNSNSNYWGERKISNPYGREENVEVDEHKEITEDSIKDKMDKSSAINKMKSYISKLNSLVNGDWNKNDLYDVVLDMRDLCEEAIYREGAFYDSVKDDDSHMIPSEIISKLIREGKWDNRTKVKYMGKVNINGKEQDKFIYGIPGGNIQYALYLKENKFQGIAQQNSNVNLPDSCKR